MRNRLWKIINLLVIILVVFTFYFNRTVEVKSIDNNKTVIIDKIDNKSKDINIKELRKQYHNNDIMAYIEIPGVTKSMVLQSSNNDYYLNHDVNKKEDIKGTVVLDFRNKINDKKLLLYGHSGKEKDLPFLKLNNYVKKDYWEKHNTINLYTLDGKKEYKIFSSYIETNDYDYVNLKSFNGLSWYEHINKLKNKSYYNTDVKLDKNDKIIILQTCSINNQGYQKYHLVIGKEV
ncbi:MAG: class B sortase [Bacilli bacterium]|nr:class B sortase [Bacilli bacterium]